MISVSCVIPHYNDSDRVVRAIDSCLEQEQLGEVIVVDDASSPEHVAALDAFVRRQKKIRLVRFAQNAGQAVARNVGAALAQTELVCFLDSDDEFLPDFFAVACRAFAHEPDIAAVKCALDIVYDDLSPVLPENDPRLQPIAFSYPCNLIVRKDVFCLIGGFPTGQDFRGAAAGEDIAFNRALTQYFNWFRINRAYCRYYWKAGSHLDKFLGRTKVGGDRWKFTSTYPDEQDGSSRKRQEDYLTAVSERLKWSQNIGLCRAGEPGEGY